MQKRDQWGSRLGFILAAAGSAVGLGNVWRFPYITGKYGGAAFVLVYLAVIIFIGMSVMLAELTLGRKGRLDSVGTFKKLGGGAWPLVGWSGFLACSIILSFYAVIAGWTFAYMIKSLTGLMEVANAGKTAEAFVAFIANPIQSTMSFLVIMVSVTYIVYRGISQGIEKACKVMMPALFVILLLLIVRSVTLDGAWAGIEFYLKPDFSKLTSEAILAAVGQGFFSLSIGIGTILTYGSYLSEEESLPSVTASVVLLDTVVAILAGLVIFPAVFAFGIDPASGAGLAFITLPGVFAKMPFGSLFSFAFFVLLFFASITSAISMLEVDVTYAVDQLKWSRAKGALVFGIAITLLGIPSVLSQGAVDITVFGKTFLDAADFLTNNIMMPLGGLCMSIFVGWFWSEGAKDEITNNGTKEFPLFTVWLWSCRIVAPVAIIAIFINGLF
ncbi:MAG: sodium-dependent transporter [Synergistaceae bacterium]